MSNMNVPTAQQPINHAQFQQFIPKITDENLKQLVNQARQQGISEEQIKQGLEFVMNMR
jgi:DNA-binding transcriptional regulator YhcF (GntR family)